MKLIFTSQTRRAISWTQGVLFGIAIAMLAYCVFVMVDARVFQEVEQRQLDRGLVQSSAKVSGNLVHELADGVMARLEIPRLGVSVMVVEGTSGRTLRRAVGHIAGTALPGQAGNVGLSGHRDTFFRPLRHITAEDIITLHSQLGELRYRVVSTRIVNPDDVSVLASDDREILTLVTCYPFYFVGPAPKRFIVRAERVI